MKKFEELTRGELYALSEKPNEIKKYKMLVLAEQGIEFPKEPKAPAKMTETPDLEVYCIDGLSSSWNDMCFENIDDARAFVDFLLHIKSLGYKSYRGEIDYKTHFFEKGLPKDYMGNEPNLSVRVERVFSKKKYDEIKKRLSEYNKAYEKYQKDLNAYNSIKAKANEATAFIDEKIDAAVADIGKKERYLNILIMDYIPLADGDIDMAMKFLKKAYDLSEDDVEYIIEHATTPAP